ncbi:MAG: glycerol-3-phosphate 1-O-acyltransferase PlsY [Thermodesulfovibrionales bacterium]
MLCMAGAFLLGSVPFGLLIARLRGVDIRSSGSGNIGATNVLRSVGKGEALLTLVADAAKGFIPAYLALRLFPQGPAAGIIGVTAVVGHVFSIFLRFRGGKGVATALGVLGAYAPLVGILTVAIWILIFLVSRISSLSAVGAFLLLPVVAYMAGEPGEKTVLMTGLSLLIIMRHKDNIGRLIRGEEAKMGRRG